MSSTIQNKRPAKLAIFGILLSVVLFALYLLVLFGTVQSNWSWVFFLTLSFLVGGVTSFFCPTVKGNGRTFMAAMGLLVFTMLILFDIYDETTNEYTGGFESGNNFLLDGLGQIAYVYLIPVIFLVYAFLLGVNIKIKSKAK